MSESYPMMAQALTELQKIPLLSTYYRPKAKKQVCILKVKWDIYPIGRKLSWKKGKLFEVKNCFSTTALFFRVGITHQL